MIQGRRTLVPYLLLLGMGVLVVIFFMTRVTDIDRHDRTVNVLLKIKQLDTVLDRDLLRVTSFTLTHYDTFVDTVTHLKRLNKLLISSELELRGEISAEIDRSVNEYLQVMDQKLALLEHVKSKAAILRNTLQYLPRVIGEFTDTGNRPVINSQIKGMLNELLVYNIFPSKPGKQRIEVYVENLAALKIAEEKEGQILDNILLHTKANMRVMDEMSETMDRYFSLPSSNLIDTIYTSYGDYYAAQARQASEFSTLLLISSLLLLGGLGYTMIHLRRARARALSTWNQLLDAVESLAEAFALFDTDEKLVLCNSKYREFLSRAKDCLTPGTPYTVIIEESRERGQFQETIGVESLFFTSLGKRRELSEPTLLEMSNGRWYLVSDNETSDGGTATVCTDITGLKTAEEELRKLSLAVEQSPAAVIITDLDGKIEYANPRFEETSGYKAKDVIGRNPRFLKSGHTSTDQYEQLWESIASGKEWRGEFHNINRKGEFYWEQASISPIKTDDGRTTHYLAVKEDITLRKAYEENLRSSVTKLRHSNTELERFAYVASHDLQEPLRTVASYVQLLRRKYKDKLDGEAQEYIDFAVDGSKRMSQLLKDLLAYSRVGTEDKNFTDVDCVASLNVALGNLGSAITKSEATLNIGSLPNVEGDAVQLSQLFQNIVGNAIKYRSHDRPLIVDITAEEVDGEWVFMVKDNGIGIDPKHFDRIFTIFQRLHLQEEYDGTGIGLALCERIIWRHEGRIWLESVPGEGSTFYFSLPVERPDKEIGENSIPDMIRITEPA